MPAIRENLKTLRNIRNLSQNEVANALNVTRQTISSYETGRTEPDWETLKRFAELYNVDIHDILYGGNQTQRKMNFIRWVAIIISTSLLLSLLIHSALFLFNNTFLVVESGTAVTSENSVLIEKRFAIRDAALNIARIGTGVFSVGCLVLIYPLIIMRKIYSLKKLITWILGLLLAMLAVTVPFMLSDKIYGYADYLLPILNVLPYIMLLLLMFIILLYLRQKSHKN